MCLKRQNPLSHRNIKFGILALTKGVLCMEKIKSTFKRIAAILLILVMSITIIPTFDIGIKAAAASYTSDYRYWSQGASDVAGVRSYGCWIVAQAKMIYEANINRETSFNPDTYYYWEKSNGYVNSGFYQINGDKAPVTYANQRGKNLEYLGYWTATDSQLWFNINAGYYTILKVNNGGHYVLLDNTTSKQKGQLYCYDSWSQSASYGTKPLSNYSSRSGGYVYKANNQTSSQPSISYSSISDGDYYLKCNSDNRYLAVSDQKDANGQPITLWNKSETFRLNIKKDTNGYVMRFPGVSSSRVVNQYADAPKNGTKVTLYNYSGSKSQSWGFQAVSGGYVIRSMYNSNLCLTGNGTGTVTVTNYTGASNQIWSLEKYSTRASLPNDFYAYIIKNDCWKHIENRNNNVQIAQSGNDSNDPKQIWHFVKTNDIYSGAYKIINEYDGTLLNVDNGGTTSGTNATSWNDLGNKYQRWYINNSSNGTYNIVAPSSGLCIDAVSNGSAAGTNIQLYTDNGTVAQQFKIYNVTNDGRTYSKPAKPAATKVNSVTYDGDNVTFKWNASPLKSSSFDKRTYTLRIYSDDTLVKAVKNISGTSYTVKLDTGVYSVKVTAVNTKYSNYSATGESVDFIHIASLNSICDTLGGHVYTTSTVKATMSKNGSVTKKCAVCGKVVSTSTIAKISSVKLSATSYTYDAKVKKPSVTVTDSNGKVLKNGTDYTVSYQSGRKNVGQYTVTVTFKGNYSGTKKLTFKIVPKGTSISKLTAGNNQFTVKWNKQTTQTTGYQIQYSTSSNMSNAKSGSTSKNTTTSATVKKLKGKTTYYVRIRTYKTVKINGESKRLYSSWSSIKKIKTK